MHAAKKSLNSAEQLLSIACIHASRCSSNSFHCCCTTLLLYFFPAFICLAANALCGFVSKSYRTFVASTANLLTFHLFWLPTQLHINRKLIAAQLHSARAKRKCSRNFELLLSVTWKRWKCSSGAGITTVPRCSSFF